MHKIDRPLEIILEELQTTPEKSIDASVDCVFDIDSDMRSMIEETGARILAVENDHARINATHAQIVLITQIDNVAYVKLPRSATSVD